MQCIHILHTETFQRYSTSFTSSFHPQSTSFHRNPQASKKCLVDSSSTSMSGVHLPRSHHHFIILQHKSFHFIFISFFRWFICLVFRYFSSLLRVLTQITRLRVPMTILTFNSKTSGLGKFLNKIVTHAYSKVYHLQNSSNKGL